MSAYRQRVHLWRGLFVSRIEFAASCVYVTQVGAACIIRWIGVGWSGCGIECVCVFVFLFGNPDISQNEQAYYVNSLDV